MSLRISIKHEEGSYIIHYVSGGCRPANSDEVDMFKRIDALEAALEEIINKARELGAEETPVIVAMQDVAFKALEA